MQLLMLTRKKQKRDKIFYKLLAKLFNFVSNTQSIGDISMANERITEDIVRTHFKEDPLFSSIKFEEQRSTNIRVMDALATASKALTGKGGKPEFIITFPQQSMDYLIVVECKADVSKHESKNRVCPKDYAVDGALHYSKHLAKEFNVISIAVSGTEDNLCVTQFIQHKNSDNIVEIKNKHLLSIYNYAQTFKNEQFSYNLKDVNIVEKAIKLNEDFQSVSISEVMRNTLVSGILLALQDDIFKGSYSIADTSKTIADMLMQALDRVLKKAKVRRADDMMNVYQGIYNEPLVQQKTLKQKKKDILSVEFFKETIRFLETQVYPLLKYEESGYDILGKFYTEFIRYAASKQKQGLVLTPSHVTDLFCDLAQIKVDDVVYDCCCGTGGFLIAAMKRMFLLAGSDEDRKNNIRMNQLLGMELRPEMFTFACSNMMLRGDGKSNLDCGSCFDDQKVDRIKKLKPTVGFLNPPYDQGVADQLKFIEKSLEVVAPQKGRVVAIVQMSCGIKDEKEANAIRERLLKKYTLKAVISMPDDLFYPVGVVTCVIVFDAVPPTIPNYKTWFGYLKDDGFVKRKNKGRIDAFDRWSKIKRKFIEAYNNNDEVLGLSVKQCVQNSPKDDTFKEWCAEAYMQTDYSTLTKKDFEDTIKRYAVFQKVGLIAETEDTDEED